MRGDINKNRSFVAALLVLLFAITYLDRVSISVAGPRIQEDLHIGPIGWSWVIGAFTVSYGVFEIPTGMLADRIGPRRVLTRIVLWWSAFTAATGMVTGYYPLLITRFLFGAGEAGAFPTSSVVVARWFPPAQRATMSGVVLMASQIGGAIAPLLVIPIQVRYGWRAAFFVFGFAGVIWATVWYVWFRDSPENQNRPSIPDAQEPVFTSHRFPWRAVAQSPSALALGGVAFAYVYAYNFFQTWFHTFLVKGRNFNEESLLISALPFVVAVCTNLAGGAASDALVKKFGRRNGRRVLGVAGLSAAGLFTIAAMLTRRPGFTVVLLTLVYGAITLQQPGIFGVCLDIGRRHAGAVTALMNTMAQVGAFLGSVAYGYIVERFHSYDAPFVPMAAILLSGALFWLRIDATQELQTEPERSAAPVNA